MLSQLVSGFDKAILRLLLENEMPFSLSANTHKVPQTPQEQFVSRCNSGRNWVGSVGFSTESRSGVSPSSLILHPSSFIPQPSLLGLSPAASEPSSAPSLPSQPPQPPPSLGAGSAFRCRSRRFLSARGVRMRMSRGAVDEHSSPLGGRIKGRACEITRACLRGRGAQTRGEPCE